MRVLRFFLVIALCVMAISTPVLASEWRDKASGTVSLTSPVGSAELEFACFEGVANPGMPGYIAPKGDLTMTSSTERYSFTMKAESVDVRPTMAFVRGRDATGSLWAVLVTDGGTPGAGNDAVWSVRYEDDVPIEVVYWEVTAGNLKTSAN